MPGVVGHMKNSMCSESMLQREKCTSKSSKKEEVKLKPGRGTVSVQKVMNCAGRTDTASQSRQHLSWVLEDEKKQHFHGGIKRGH